MDLGGLNLIEHTRRLRSDDPFLLSNNFRFGCSVQLICRISHLGTKASKKKDSKKLEKKLLQFVGKLSKDFYLIDIFSAKLFSFGIVIIAPCICCDVFFFVSKDPPRWESIY